MRTRLEDDLYAPTPGALHFNVMHKGNILSNRVTARHFVSVKPEQIEWAWIIESKRYASPKEIANLCAGKPLQSK